MVALSTAIWLLCVSSYLQAADNTPEKRRRSDASSRRSSKRRNSESTASSTKPPTTSATTVRAKASHRRRTSNVTRVQALQANDRASRLPTPPVETAEENSANAINELIEAANSARIGEENDLPLLDEQETTPSPVQERFAPLPSHWQESEEQEMKYLQSFFYFLRILHKKVHVVNRGLVAVVTLNKIERPRTRGMPVDEAQEQQEVENRMYDCMNMSLDSVDPRMFLAYRTAYQKHLKQQRTNMAESFAFVYLQWQFVWAFHNSAEYMLNFFSNMRKQTAIYAENRKLFNAVFEEYDAIRKYGIMANKRLNKIARDFETTLIPNSWFANVEFGTVHIDYILDPEMAVFNLSRDVRSLRLDPPPNAPKPRRVFRVATFKISGGVPSRRVTGRRRASLLKNELRVDENNSKSEDSNNNNIFKQEGYEKLYHNPWQSDTPSQSS